MNSFLSNRLTYFFFALTVLLNQYIIYQGAGSLYFSDLASLIFIFFICCHYLIGKKNFSLGYKLPLKLFFTLLTIYLISQLYSDLYSAISLPNFIKGLSRSIFLALSAFFAFYILKDIELGKERFRTLIYLYLFSYVIVFLFQKNTYTIDGNNPVNTIWKFGIAIPVSFFLISLSSITKNSFILFVACFLVGILNLILDARIWGLIFLTTSFLIIFLTFVRIINIKRNIYSFLAVNFLSISISLIIFFTTLKFFLPLMPKAAFVKNSLQLSNGGINMIKSSRPEFFAAFQPSIETFFYGHGTWTPISSIIAGPHSHIMQAFFEYGFIASLFWVYIILIIIYLNWLEFLKPTKNNYLFYLFSFFLLWDILFSPFAGNHRFITLFYFSIIILYKRNVFFK
jgi:hypothetical protein